MYGVINYSVKTLVLEKFGQDTWTRICAEAGVEDDDFKFHEYHPDGQTVSLVLAASKVLGVEADQVLEIYGEYFLKFLEDEAMDKILHIMGSNLADFLDNLDWLHQHLRGTWQDALFPHFRREVRGDGDVDLYYQSGRGSLLAPFIKGLLSAIADKLYHTPVEIKILEVSDKGAQFHIHFVPQDTVEGDTHKQAAQAKNETSSAGQENHDAASRGAAALQAAGLPMDFFLSQWPFFVLMNEDMTLIAAGPSLTQKVPSAVPGANFHDLFHIEMPEAAAKGSFADFKEHAHAPFRARSIDPVLGGSPLVLRGAMHCVEPSPSAVEQKRICMFLCSAVVSSLDMMVDGHIKITDFTLHDAARDLLFLSESHVAQTKLMVRLEELSTELAEEQDRSEELLFSMLPRSVVEDLKEGRRVRGQEYEAVTILFSDIVGFTDMSAQCKPTQVCHMLDELYTVFDAISASFDVYKVETIGDAYMVAGGITGDKNKHATATADMGYAMRLGAALIKSPLTHQSLQIRIGMHSGPVLTGVVGTKMPRYCLFGDTVNMASRMESNGLPGKIHCSTATAMLLQDADYTLEDRGEIEIKGKGLQSTHWLEDVPKASRRVIKRALAAAAAALKQLREFDDRSASSDDGVARVQIRHPSTDKIEPTPTDTPDTPEEAGAEPVSKLRHWNQDKKFRLSGDRKVRPSRTASGSPGTNSSSELRDFFFLMAPENVSKEKKLESWDRSVKTSKRVSGGGQGRDVESRAARAGAQTNAGRDEAEYSADDDDNDVPVTGSPQRTERPSGEELASAFGVTAASGRARCPFGFDMLAAAADEVLEAGKAQPPGNGAQ